MHCTVCTAVFEELQYANAYSAAAAVVVFFALTDRASTISSSTYVYLVDIQSGPRGRLDRKMSEEQLQSSKENTKTKQNTKAKQKRQKERNNNKKHTPEKNRRALDRESLVQYQPRAIRYPPRIAIMHPNALCEFTESQGRFLARQNQQ